jgi:hypothetical protein
MRKVLIAVLVGSLILLGIIANGGRSIAQQGQKPTLRAEVVTALAKSLKKEKEEFRPGVYAPTYLYQIAKALLRFDPDDEARTGAAEVLTKGLMIMGATQSDKEKGKEYAEQRDKELKRDNEQVKKIVSELIPSAPPALVRALIALLEKRDAAHTHPLIIDYLTTIDATTLSQRK